MKFILLPCDFLAFNKRSSPVRGGQRAARLPLVHMVVPLVATSNAFAPLADDDDQPTASRDATSAMDPAPSAISEVMRVRWTVMTTLSARRSIKDTLGIVKVLHSESTI